MEKELTAKEHGIYFGRNANILYLATDVGYIATYICQTSLSPNLKKWILLHGSYISIKIVHYTSTKDILQCLIYHQRSQKIKELHSDQNIKMQLV